MLFAVTSVVFQAIAPANPPRAVVLIYADDLGYGDVSCNGATAIRTPHVDRLAREGLRFIDGHSSSATCTPSRYALLTGEYPWRKKGTGVLPGDARLIIEPGRSTLASVMRQAGYRTGVVGKWHLGLGDGDLDWNGEIRPGPLEIGFDEAFIIPATGDRVPCVYVENYHVVGLDPADPIRVSFGERVGDDPIGAEHPELLKMKFSHGHDRTIINGISRIGTMSGGKAARWIDEDMADVITRKAVTFIEQNRERPFFLFFSTHDIHVPRAPHARFVGKSGLGPRGDAILEFDWSVGEILAALDRHDLAKDTLVILSSDNGPVVDDGYQDEAVTRLGDHQPSGPLRGGKYSSFEGGTRVPLVVRWPAEVKPGVSAALVCQIDLLSSLAKLNSQTVANPCDSVDVLPALLGTSPVGREELVEHARVLSLREGFWKYIEPTTGPKIQKNTNTELGGDSDGQLFNLASDLGERRDLAAEHPGRVLRMQERLQQIHSPGDGTAKTDR
jgi:arylsulfatase A-like enzyme